MTHAVPSMSRAGLTILFVLTICGAVASASDTLTLEQCLTIAEANSPELRIAVNAVRSSEFGKTVADKARWPRLSFAGNAGYAPASLSFGYDPAVSNGGELGARVVAEQVLYNGGLNGLDIRQASVQVENQSLVWQLQERDLVLSVRQAFVDLLLAQQQVDIRDSSVNRLRNYLGLVERLNEAGAVSYTDFLNTQVDLTNAQVAAMSAAEAVRTARFSLARLMNAPDDTTFMVSGSLESLLIDVQDTAITMPELDVTSNLDIASTRLGRTQSEIALAQTRARCRPTVSAVADAGVVTSRENLLLPEAERYRSVGYSIGVSVEVPLWDWGTRKAEIQRSSLDLKSSGDFVDIVSRDIVTEYRTTRSQLLNALKRLESIRRMTETAQKNYLLSTAQYADGAVSASEVLIAQQMLTDAHQTGIETLAETQSLKARLMMITQSVLETRP